MYAPAETVGTAPRGDGQEPAAEVPPTSEDARKNSEAEMTTGSAHVT